MRLIKKALLGLLFSASLASAQPVSGSYGPGPGPGGSSGCALTGCTFTGTIQGAGWSQTASGVGTGASLALGGATIGSNALAVTGTSNISGSETIATNTVVSSTGTSYTNTQNALSTGLLATNANASTASRVAVTLSNGTTSLSLVKNGTGFTTNTYQVQDGDLVLGLGTGGLNLVEGANAPVRIYSNGTIVSSWSTAGQILSIASSDGGATDATVCRKTSDGTLLIGSGTLGICLGTSSERFKRNITPMAPSLAGWEKLKFVNFRYKPNTGHDATKYQNGLLVEDVAKVFPDCTGPGKDGKLLTLDPFCMVFHGMKAQQEQQAEIRALRAANDNMEKRLAILWHGHSRDLRK